MGSAVEFGTWLIGATLVWGIPLGFVLTDSLVTPRERAAWVIVVLFTSWIGGIIFLLVAPLKPKDSHYQ